MSGKRVPCHRGLGRCPFAQFRCVMAGPGNAPLVSPSVTRGARTGASLAGAAERSGLRSGRVARVRETSLPTKPGPCRTASGSWSRRLVTYAAVGRGAMGRIAHQTRVAPSAIAVAHLNRRSNESGVVPGHIPVWQKDAVLEADSRRPAPAERILDEWPGPLFVPVL